MSKPKQKKERCIIKKNKVILDGHEVARLDATALVMSERDYVQFKKGYRFCREDLLQIAMKLDE